MKIAASDIVELVEVSAPGYKTMRYWLTFDRPTHLNATLIKGEGLVEASEEQTLVALGELSAPDTKEAAKPAAAPAIAPAKMVGDIANVAAPRMERTVAEPVPAARKIGKGAADEQPAVAIEPTTIENPTSDSDPVPAVGKPELPEQPAVVIENPNVEEPKSEVVMPKAEPAKPAIDQATLSAVVGKNRPTVLKCFAEGKKQNPKLKGTLTLALAVDASGKVTRVQVQSTITGNPLVAACVVKAAYTWHFPGRSEGGMANVAYPFVIN